MGTGISSALQDERFLLLETLGRGGMADVFRAFDRVEQRVVAIKVSTDSTRFGPSNPLTTEFDHWSRMRHPNVVRAYELGLARRGPIRTGSPYLVLEHVDGGPVNRVLRAGRVAPALVEEIAVEVLQGLAHVHEAGMVHRDLKPGNVLIRGTCDAAARVKLTDFGLAATRGLREEPGTFSGSLPFVAPEALLGGPVDGRTDLYGLGVMLYHLATGEMPAGCRGVEELLRWHLSGPPADPRRIRPRYPARLARFIARLTGRSPGRRPTDCHEALALLGVDRTSAATPRPDLVDRGLRARLRLAMDAARLGARRLFVLPRRPASSPELVRQVAVWSQTFGLFFHRLETAADAHPSPLCRMILRLLLERGGDAKRLAKRYALERSIPLRLIDGVPVWDRARTGLRTSRDGATPARAAHLARFLLECSARRPIVIHAERSAAADPLARGVVERLVPRFGNSIPGATRGGFLLLDEGFSSATRRDNSSRD